MKRIAIALLVLLILPAVAYSAQQIVNDLDGMGTVRSKINANFTEVYDVELLAWDSSTSYADGEMVFYGQEIWVALQTTSVGVAPVEGAYWTALIDEQKVGDVVGPASSTDGVVAVFDSTTGKLLKVGTGCSISGAVLTCTGGFASSSATPTVEFNDSDAAGSDAADEYAGSIEANMTTVTEDAEVSDVVYYYMDGGTKTTAFTIDGSDNQVEFAIPITVANIRDKVLRSGIAVDDDDCTGEQGKWWYDTTDSAFEFCNADSGTPTTFSGPPATADISDVNVTQTEFAELEEIGASTISAAQWAGLGAATTAGIDLIGDADAATQRTTLGVGTGDSPSFTQVQIGGAQIDHDDMANLVKMETTVTTEQLRLNYDATNYLTATVDAEGATTITTVDADAANADLTFSPDGTIILTPATDVVGALTAGSLGSDTGVTLTGADADPDAAGEIVYDSTITGIMAGGGLRWFDDDSVRLIVDLETDPSNDDYVVAYDAAADGFYMKVDDDSGGAPAFSDITGATNTTAAMVVGTGGSLAVSGSGTIAATTAAALAADGANCTDGKVSIGVDEDGVAQGCVYPEAVQTASKSAAYTIGTDDDREMYGGVIYVTSAAEMTLPAVAAGMNFTVIGIGAIAVTLDPDAGGTEDTITLDGTDLAQGANVTSTSVTGQMITCAYYKADYWYCASGDPSGDPWTGP